MNIFPPTPRTRDDRARHEVAAPLRPSRVSHSEELGGAKSFRRNEKAARLARAPTRPAGPLFQARAVDARMRTMSGLTSRPGTDVVRSTRRTRLQPTRSHAKTGRARCDRAAAVELMPAESTRRAHRACEGPGPGGGKEDQGDGRGVAFISSPVILDRWSLHAAIRRSMPDRSIDRSVLLQSYRSRARLTAPAIAARPAAFG